MHKPTACVSYTYRSEQYICTNLKRSFCKYSSRWINNLYWWFSPFSPSLSWNLSKEFLLGSPVCKTDTQVSLLGGRCLWGSGMGGGAKGSLVGSPVNGSRALSWRPLNFWAHFGNCCHMWCPTSLVHLYSISFPQYSMFFSSDGWEKRDSDNSFSHCHIIEWSNLGLEFKSSVLTRVISPLIHIVYNDRKHAGMFSNVQVGWSRIYIKHVRFLTSFYSKSEWQESRGSQSCGWPRSPIAEMPITRSL